MQLRQLTGQFLELSDAATNPDSELNEESIKDTLEAIEGEFKEKAESVAAVIINFDSDIESIDKEIKRLDSRKRVLLNRKDGVRDYIKQNMIATGITKISCPLFSITLASGRDVVEIYDEESLDPEYLSVKTSISPDKKKILSSLKGNVEIMGARLSKSEPSLRIK